MKDYIVDSRVLNNNTNANIIVDALEHLAPPEDADTLTLLEWLRHIALELESTLGVKPHIGGNGTVLLDYERTPVGIVFRLRRGHRFHSDGIHFVIDIPALKLIEGVVGSKNPSDKETV